MVALPGICTTHETLPPRYLVTGDLTVDYNSTICVGGVALRRGILDGCAVTVKSLSLYSTPSSSDSQEVASNIRTKPCLPKFTSSLERVQGNCHLEELEASEYIASSWRRHVHSAFFCNIAVSGIRELERVSRAFPKCLEGEIGKAVTEARLKLSDRFFSYSVPRKAWNTCITWIASMVT